MRNRKALSSVVGVLFSVIALVSVITYITYGINSLEKFNQQVLVENTETVNQGDETFDTVKAETVNNKFNITVQNTGNLPIKITRLWIQNKTDPSWGTYKYDINVSISPGEVASNIGQNLNLYTLDTQGYEAKLTTERGSAVEFLINSPTEESLGMKLVPSPDTIPTDFTTTVIYQIVNNSTGNNMLLNLQPQLSASGTAASTLISGPTPASYPTLVRGDTATFVWVYKLTGDDGTTTTFNATLANAKQGNWVTATATVKTPLYSVQAGTVLGTSAISSSPLIDSLLLFHNETLLTPGIAYQMYSADSDAGINGSMIELDKKNPKFFTNNGSAVSIPAGAWVGSLRLQSEAMPNILLNNPREDMIFHFQDGQGASPDNSQNSASRDLISCSGAPTWESNTGPHGSGSYKFDGINDCFESKNSVAGSDGNNIDTEPDTTALWFKTDGVVTSEQYLVYWEGGSDYYKISLNSTGGVLFRYDTGGGNPSTCTSTKEYDDNQWHHVVAVRKGPPNDDDCALYITDTNAVVTDSIALSYGSSGSTVSASGKWKVGANKLSTANWFKGSIDDIFHWNSRVLNSTEAYNLAKTNYGTGAHKLNFYLGITDQDGNYITTLVNNSAVAVPFFDPKGQNDTDDGTYGTFNTTMALSKINWYADERLNFTISWVPSTTNWMPLELDMKIDDENMAPYPSFLQIPQPDATLPGYYTFDNDNEITVLVSNPSSAGVWFTYQGSRVTFDDLSTPTSYAGIIKRVNGTILDVNNDSILLPPGYVAQVNFTQPKSTPTNSTGTVDLIPPSTYKMYVYLKGYDETGQLFLRTKNLGSVTVID